jgi:hypothetical protein
VDIYPGDSAQIAVTFVNTGSSPVQSAQASANSSGVEVKWAGSTQSIGQIGPRSSAIAIFSIEAPKNMSAGSYPLHVRLDYVSENKSLGSSDFSFLVPVKPKAEFEAHEATDSLLPGQQKQVQIQLTNTGSEAAHKVQARIRPLFPFSTDGTVRYIESLAPGKSVNLTYDITVDKEATSGQQLIGMLVNFEDPQGKKFSDSADFAMDVKTPTLQDDIYGFWYVGVIAVVLVLLMARGRLSAKKK